jgi:hypothetical protein
VDANRFDQVAKTLLDAGTCRRLLGRLAALPLVAALGTLVSEESEAGRRRRRKARHHPGERKRKNKKGAKNKSKKKAKPGSDACASVLQAAGCVHSGAWRCVDANNLSKADLSGCDLTGAQLIAVDLFQANLDDAGLFMASLKNTKLQGATLRDADLVGATLEGTDLTGANLEAAELGHATLTNVTWNNTTCPDGANSNDQGNTCCGNLNGANVVHCS